MAKGKKRAAAEPFVYVGAGDYGQHTVSDAPGFKKGKRASLRTGICIMQAEVKGGPLREVGFWSGPAVGWIEYNPRTKHLYAVASDEQLHSLSIQPDGSLVEVSSAETLGGSCHLEISPDGAHALVANYGAGVLAVLPLRADGTIGPASDPEAPHPIPSHPVPSRPA